jgi:hypothetical protein
MSVTISDETTALALARTVGPQVEVYGPDGRLLGRFTPAPRPGMMFPELGMTDAELDMLENDPNAKWFTTEDVSARLRSLQGGA